MSQIDNSKRTAKTEQQPAGYPDLKSHEEEILIVVKTYPRPSTSYKEIVCTAGITRNERWIRLYPVNYRYMQYPKWYKKYQWVKVKIEKNLKDFRVDSYRPDVESIKPEGQPLDTKKDKSWLQRKEIVIPTIHYNSLEEIANDYKKFGVSLGIFKPKKIIDLKIKADSAQWSSKHQRVQSQLVLFGQQPKTLKKIPYKFIYEFICNDSRCKGHQLSIFDWEIFMLYLRLMEEKPFSMDIVLKKIKQKWLDEMWSEKRDSYLIVGTQFPNPTFLVLGVFWPPKY
ncbi:hypothetical protein HYU92_01240 [Candidatus Curtissbacteria bacterium]|nr:hypothetical protein [Candidatus Curtissbacteria bacterium]